MEGSCKYIEYIVAYSRQGVALECGGWARCQQLNIKTYLVMKYSHRKIQTWTDTKNGQEIWYMECLEPV